MNSKERVHAALRREPVDRVPIFMWYHPETKLQLSELLGIYPDQVPAAMGDDIRQTWVGANHGMEGIVHQHEGETHIDAWGIEWVRLGHFNQVKTSPLQHASREHMLAYQFPYGQIDQLLNNLKPVMQHASDYFVGADVSPCLFEMWYRLRGMDNALLDLVAEPELTQTMLERCGDFAQRIAAEACSRYQLDWLWTGDDVAGQQRLMMRPQLWREMIKPLLAPIVAVAKGAGIWSAHHCCGALRPIIPDLIEIGVQVLNPVQGNCPGMEPAELKREYGKELAFMGGIDTQDLLPNGTAAEVRRVTEHLLERMTADGGGYILAASHTIPHETPIENIFAMYEAAGITREQIFDRAANIRTRSWLAYGQI